MRMNIRGFGAASEGNFSILAALAAVPVVLAVGVALDLSTINQTRTRLQQAIDSAVLAVAREGKTITDDRARDIAARFLEGNFDPTYTKLKVKRVGTSFTVSAETSAGVAFSKLFGYDDMPVAALASADIAYANYEIALVLDTTGSMKGGKLASMKDAVIGLLDTMPKQVNDDEKLKFAMVPFSSFVNVGSNSARYSTPPASR